MARQSAASPNAQLALATIAFAVSFSLWGLISALAPRFRDIYGLSPFETSAMIAIPVILGSLLRIPMGILADRFGGRRVFALLLAFGIVPALGVALVPGYGALLFWGFLLGAAGSSFAVGVSFASRWFPPERQGFALGVFGIGNIGQSVATFFAPRLAAQLGWQAFFALFGALSLLWALAFWSLARDAPPRGAPHAGRIAEVFLRERLSWLFAFFYFITFGGFVALGIYLPTLLVGQFHLALGDAGMRTAGFVVLATLMRPVGGRLADAVGGARVLGVAFAAIVILALLLVASSFVVFTIGALGIAAMLGMGNGAVFKLVPQHFPASVGPVTGLVGALGGLGGFFPPIVLGVVKQATGSYAAGFVLLALFAAFACALDVAILVARSPGRAASAAATGPPA